MMSLRLFFAFSLFLLSDSLTLEFLESNCGGSYSFTTSFHLDSSTGLTYKNLLNCTLTVNCPANFFVLAHVTRFELEAAFTGTCLDYLNVYDGSSLTSTALNANPLCGWSATLPVNFTASGTAMTLEFVTNNLGRYHGFNMVFAAATNAPCSSSQFACDNSICVDSSLECDGYNQCGDGSDEANCANTAGSGGLDVVMVVVIVLAAVVVVAAVVGLLVYRVRQRKLWKKFVNSQLGDENDAITEAQPSYPITYRYYKGIRGHPVSYDSTHGDGIGLEKGGTFSDDGLTNHGKATNGSNADIQASTSSVVI